MNHQSKEELLEELAEELHKLEVIRQKAKIALQRFEDSFVKEKS